MTAKIEPRSDTWQFVIEWAEKELNEARAKNDSKALKPKATAALRGRIETLKQILTLADPPKEKPSPPPSFEF